MLTEEWKVIEVAPKYLISNYGEVQNAKTGRILRQALNHNGYLMVNLMTDNKPLTRRVHRLVGMTFFPNFDIDLDINHIDGNKLNNYVGNLEWVTRRDNIRHAFATGLSVSGKRTPVRIVETGEVFESQAACAEAIDGWQPKINAVLKGKASHHKGYTFEYA